MGQTLFWSHKLTYHVLPSTRILSHRAKAPRGFGYKLLGMQWTSQFETPEPSQTLTHWKLMPRFVNVTDIVTGIVEFNKLEKFLASFVTYTERTVTVLNGGAGGIVVHGVIPLYGFVTTRFQFIHGNRYQPASNFDEGYVTVFYELVRVNKAQAIWEWLKSS